MLIGKPEHQQQLANSAVKLCSQTCRYIIKRLTCGIYAGCLQNELPALLENDPLPTRLETYYQHDVTQSVSE